MNQCVNASEGFNESALPFAYFGESQKLTSELPQPYIYRYINMCIERDVYVYIRINIFINALEY